MDARHRLLLRIRKLLALASSGSGHEAAAAERLADRLMRQHGVSREDLAEARPGRHELDLGGSGWGALWRAAVLTFAASCNEVAALFRREGGRTHAKLAGDRPGVERARDCYENLIGVIEDLVKILVERRGDAIAAMSFGIGTREALDSLRRGIVFGLVQLMDEQHEAVEIAQPRAPAVESGPGPGPGPGPGEVEAGTAARGRGDAVAVPPASAGVLARSRAEEKPRWRPMRDPSAIFQAQPNLFELGRRTVRLLVVVDAAGYAKIRKLKAEART